MKKILILSTVLAFSCTAFPLAAQTGAKNQSLGKAVTVEGALSTARLSGLLQDRQQLENVTLMGYITEVCQKEGCWLRISSEPGGADNLLVKVKDHAFAVPKQAAGKKVAVLGNVSRKTQTVAEQQHYLKDAGGTDRQLAEITGTRNIYEMQATGIKILD